MVERNDLSGGQKQVSDLFDRFAESEPFAGPFVDLVGDASELLRRDLPQVGALGASVFVKRLVWPS